MKTNQDFHAATDRWPEDDDMDRVNCPFTGQLGHEQCGWCEGCNKPKFMCRCVPENV